MKLKYFLRGLGTGVIFGALIMLVAYMTSGGYKLSDEEIIERAEKLGMVAQEPIIKEDTEETLASDTGNSTTEKTSEEVTTEEATTEKATTEDSTTQATTTEEVTAEEATTEATTEETTTEEPTTQDGKYTKATITVTSGMSSTDVARLVQEAGIIKDYLEFDSFLNANGYSTQIRVKTTELNSNMTFEEIALALTSGEDEN